MINPEVVKLIEQMAHAKLKLREMKRSHTEGCASQDLTGHVPPCSCGASAHNSQVDAIIDLLKIS